MSSLGFDTSCYTTSVALVDKDIISLRKILEVPIGKTGLRQSDALFLHTKNLPVLMKQLKGRIFDVEAVGVSSKPRDEEDSYMPVFLAGVAVAKAVAAALNVPVYEFSHQKGHIMAGLIGKDVKQGTAIHLSGGTTEILEFDDHLNSKIIGKTLDIPAGQLVDRIGVKLGLPFPCGVHLEELALKTTNYIALPVSVRGRDINFSGAEAKAQQYIDEGKDRAMIARGLLLCIAESLIKATAERENCLFVGGVVCNSIIKDYILSKMDALFSQKEYSGDNAVGIALLAKKEIQ